ncbi:putative glycoprotein [Arthronema virus TR020]|uniref:Putative glycoprotein n=1 Tax=Arthronema virus TR020 TaxID=2736280 RepID=A0A7G3WH22_9CAUD|nr:putative glycoprotein [Arthronema virus TR020]
MSNNQDPNNNEGMLNLFYLGLAIIIGVLTVLVTHRMEPNENDLIDVRPTPTLKGN